MVLAMTISWKGTLQQYAGRLHREHASMQDVGLYDYLEHEQSDNYKAQLSNQSFCSFLPHICSVEIYVIMIKLV